MIRAAIAGLGRWGRSFVESVQGSERLRFIHCVETPSGTVNETTRRLAAQHGLALTDDLGRVLADARVDAIVLATPHSLHREQVIACASGVLATVRATPFYWRIHVFGTAGSAEVLGETEIVLHRANAKPQTISLDSADSLLAELEAFADAIRGRAPFPITHAQMLDTTAAFEATLRAIETGQQVEVNAR